jgi:deoxycytidylate deaminase
MIPASKLAPYYKIALQHAKESPCTRRRYGAVIAYDKEPIMSIGFNARVTSCCDNGICIRDRAGLVNGLRTELGSEVHAEQAVLIEAPRKGLAFILAGWQVVSYYDLVELTGTNVFPCLVCARMIKYAGYKWVTMKMDTELESIHIEDIIEYRERELGPHYE